MADTKDVPVFYRVAFHLGNMSFFPPVPVNSTGGIAPPVGAGTNLTAHALTKIADPESATPTAIRSFKNNSNRPRPKEGPDGTPRLTANPNSDVTLAGSSG